MIRRLFFFPLDGGYVEHLSRDGKSAFLSDPDCIEVTGLPVHEFCYLSTLRELSTCQYVHQAPALLQ